MSRAINTSVATIQFQVNARQASAAMQALQDMAKKLGDNIDSVNRNIKNLGEGVPKDNPDLLNYQNQLKALDSQLKDVQKAQRDFLKGAKAADQLWKAAGEGNIESLSFRSIKAGINGLKKRQEGLSPGDAQDMKDWRIIKEVIDEADRVMKQAGADVQNVVQTIREGGKVSEQTMRQTISTLKELKGSVDETDADFRTYGSDLDFMEAKLKDFNDAQRRAKGEIVDANDARREMNKLTEEGRRQAEFQKQQAEWEVKFYEQKNQQLEVQRQKQQAAIDQAKQQIDAQQQLIEQKHSQLAADEESFNKEQQTRHTKIDGMKQEARTARDLADEKKEIADEQIETEKYWQHQLNETGQKITDIKTKLEELRTAKLKPQVDTSEIDALKTDLNEIENQLNTMGGMHTAEMTAFNQRLWKKQDSMKEVGSKQYLPHVTDPDADFFNFGNKAKKIIKSFAAGGDDRRFDLMQSLAERGGYLEKLKELESEKRAIVKQRTEYVRAMDETGKKDWEEAIRQLDELDGLYSTVINILKDYKQEFDKIKPADDAHLEKYEALTERRATLLEKIASVEQQSASATNQDTEAVKNEVKSVDELETELGELEKKIKKLKDDGMYDPSDGSIADAIKDRLETAKKHSDEADEWSSKASRTKDGSKKNVEYLHNWEESDQWRQSYEDQAEALQKLEPLLKRKAEIEQQIAQVQSQSTTATKSETEAIQKKNQELERTKAYIELEKGNISRNQGYYDQAIKDLKEMGLAEKDITDQAKIQEAIEKKTLEIMEAEVNAGKEAAEQRRELVSKITSSQLGGSKADQDFYAKHAGEYELSQYKDTDEIMERIAHLEMVSKLKNGKRFSDDTHWDPDDEVDEDELYVMTDEEKEAALNELRILKQHIREELLKTLNLEGDIDNAVLEMTGGDGFSEDAKFGEQLNDKLQSIKEKIEEKIQTSLDKYDDIVNMEYSEAWDDNGKLDKEKVRKNVAEYIEDTIQEVSGSKTNIDESRESIKEYKENIVRLNGEIEKLNQTEEQSNEKTQVELDLEQELTDTQEKNATAQSKLNDAKRDSAKATGEYVEANKKAEEQEGNLAKATKEADDAQAKHDEHMKDGLDTISKMGEEYEGMKTRLEGQEQALADTGKQMAETNQHITESEAKKQQAQQLTIQKMEEMLAALRKENNEVIPANTEKWRENEAEIEKLDQTIRELKGEWMSYGDAMKYASSIGSDGFMATDEQTKMATEALTRHREELIKTIQQKEADSQATAAECAELEQLDQALTKIKTGFTSADDVMTRWAEHMNAGKQATETMSQQTETLAQTLDEKLAGATSSWDAKIEAETSYLEDCNKELDRYEQELQELSDKLKELEQKHSNHSWLWKKTHAREYQREEARIEWLREETGSGNTFDEEGNIKRATTKGLVDDMRNYKQEAQERLAQLKQLKAEELGLTESEVQAEEKKADAKRLTNEQMQEGIKLLEEEYAKTDHTTEEGIKKREQLREAIDQMNQELKESTGEWMSVADAMKLAGQAEKNTFLGNDGTGFTASAQDIQKATQALERQRDVILQTIKAKRDSGKATDDEEKELQDLTNKLKALKFEQDNFNMSQAKMQELMRTPTNAVSLDELRSAIKRADGELKRMEGSLGQNNAQYKAFAEQVRNAKNQLKEMEGQAKASATAWEKAWSRLKTYVVMYMGFNALWQKVMGTADDLMQLSDKMGEVRKTTGFTADEVGRLSDELKKLDTRTTITGLLDLSVAAGQLGLKTQEDVEGFTIAANKLMVALPEMGKEGATEMLKVALATGEIDKIRKQMEQGLIDGSSATAVAMEKVGSTIDRLRATSAATAPAITDFVKRVGAVGAQSGISIDQVAALGSTVDALGMRVEMSATALSRMIPAIKNNAFDVAKAIGVTPNTLRDLFEAGRGMEAVLLIFQKIKDSGMGADDIDKMLGMGNMKEVMKELNQQGARAGIVFAGLSQNVDTLREHLNTASKAYEENIAIQQEYDKMNETTAARWERLKNVVEELFVGDASQRWLGGIIDGLRTALDIVVDLIDYVKAFGYSFAAWKIGVGGAIWAYLINPLRLAITETHSLGTQIKRVAATWRTAWRSMDAATKANLIMAIGTAVYYLGKAIWDTCTKVSELAKAMAEVDEQEVVAIRDINRLSKSLTDAIPKANGLANNHKNLKEETDALRKELDELKKSTDKSAEAHGKLSKKTEELEKKEKDLKAAEDESNKANKERSSLITEINSKYSTYLGYMLNEETAALQVAQAHRQIVAALKEEMEQKRMNRQQEAINAKYDEKIAGYQTDAQDELSNLPADIQRRIMNRFNSVLANITFEIDPNTQKGIFRRSAAEGFGEKVYREREGVDNASYASFELMQPILKELIKQEAIGQQGVTLTTKDLDKYVKDAWGLIGVDAGFWQLSLNSLEKERQTMELRNQSDQTQKALHATSVSEADKANIYAYMKIKDITGGLAENQELSSENVKSLAQQVNIITGNLSKFKDELKNADSYIGKDNDATLENAVNTMFAALSEKQRKQILNAAKRSSKVGTDTGGGAGGGGGTNPWGGNAPAESTDYATWDVNELVARRNQMDKFKNVLKPDTDIRAVLAEDKALMKALDNGLKEDWKSVLGWYNTERKKIQKELKSERFSTNEGHWRDEKNGSRKNHFRESDYALAELDRYYSKRKEELEKARIEENMSEELFNRQAELLEQEHLERRSKLRETFTAGNTKAEKEMVKQFREWWSKLEKDGKLDEVPWATVESEWAKALASEIGRNNLKAQQDLTQMQQITVKHLNKIADIIAKERPYDGIVDNLRKNLTEMDILFADMEKKGATDPATLVKEQNTRLQFLLGEAETAYQSSIDEVLRRMADAGMTAWAEEIGKSDAMKNALMAQLQTAYDEIQNAIKKEASQIKKQTDIWWNDLMPGQETSRKGGFEKILTRLGLQEDQVKRANALIGAGAASERVADKLAIKQMQIRLQMQQVYYQKMRQMWNDRIRSLREQGKEIDAQHAEISKQLSLSEEQKKLDEQRVAIANQLEESQNRLYTSLKEWGDLLASSVKDLMEASHAGEADYYNELAKLNLTGKGGPGAGTYVVIDNAGTSDAEAHYEYLDERAALERQLEIEQENAKSEAWRKVWDDLNAKMNEQITDWINAQLQNQAVYDNTKALKDNTDQDKQHLEILKEQDGIIEYATDATRQNTDALGRLTTQLAQGITINPATDTGTNSTGEQGDVGIKAGNATGMAVEGGEQSVVFNDGVNPGVSWMLTDEQLAAEQAQLEQRVQMQEDAAERVRIANEAAFHSAAKTESDTDKQMVKSNASSFAKMTMAANLYGVAYQAVSNDNLSATQKWEMIALQSVGNYAISSLTAVMSEAAAKGAVSEATVLGKLWSQLGLAAAPVFAIFTGLLGAAMGAATSKVAKSKSQIAQATGASSASAGKLTTGMLTYAEGNVNEFTDPDSLTPGRSYNVDAADGKTYRAKYTGRNPKTHITTGPEFHLVGEKGREAIIDAHTTRNIQLNEPEIWRNIQTLYNGGSLRHTATRRGRGVRAFAEGNIDEFEMSDGGGMMADSGLSPEMLTGFQSSLDKNNELLERALTQGIHAKFDVYGRGGLVDSYDTGKKTVQRHGERY